MQIDKDGRHRRLRRSDRGGLLERCPVWPRSAGAVGSRRSILDEDHGGFEQRWITMGRARDGRLLVVSHTDARAKDDKTSVRLISARPVTRNEQRQFESGE